jgi:hypothetical protein
MKKRNTDTWLESVVLGILIVKSEKIDVEFLYFVERIIVNDFCRRYL